MRTRRFNEPIEDAYAFRQAQTAANVDLWHRFGFSMIDYHVPVFGGGVWIHEFPFYQLLVYLIAPVSGGTEHAGRLVSIGAFALAMFAVFRISARAFSGGSVVAPIASAVAFTFVPINVFYFRAFLLDPLALACVLIAVLASVELSRRHSWVWFSVLGVGITASTLSKSSITFVYVFMIAILLLRASFTWRMRERLALYLFATGIAIANVTWVLYAGSMNENSNGMSWEMMQWWYFGSKFTDVGALTMVWSRIPDQLGYEICGVALFGAVVGILRSSRWRMPILGLSFGAIAYVPVFTNLNQVHDYYQLPLYPVVAIFFGAGAVVLLRLLNRRLIVFGMIIIVLICAQFVQNARRDLTIGYFGSGAVDYALIGIAKELNSHTPDSLLVVIGDGVDKNDPRLLYEAGRIGTSVPLWNAEAVHAAIQSAPARTVIVMGDPIHSATLSIRYQEASSAPPVFVLLGPSQSGALSQEIINRGYRLTYRSNTMIILRYGENLN